MSSIPNSQKPEIIISTAERRMPVYLLLDTSGSMTGAPIEAVRRGVEQCKEDLLMDPQTAEIAHIGVITFGGIAKFVTQGLVPIEHFEPPVLLAGGQTPLGQALWLLNESLDKDVKVGVKGKERGDYKPLIYILTDGEPTDDWQQPRDELVKRLNRKVINIVTVGCGLNINQSILKEMSLGDTFNMGTDVVSFRNFFKWVSQTVTRTSKACSQSGSAEKPVSDPPTNIQPIF